MAFTSFHCLLPIFYSVGSYVMDSQLYFKSGNDWDPLADSVKSHRQEVILTPCAPLAVLSIVI